MTRLLAAILIGLVLACGAQAQTASSETHTVGPGDSLYGIVAINYPERMARWTDVAADLVALNPEAFPNGLDTVLRLGDELVLVDYSVPDTPTSASEQSVSESTSGATAPQPAAAAPVQREAEADRADDSAQPGSGRTVTREGTTSASDTSATPSEDNRAIGYVASVTSQAIATDHQNQQRTLSRNDRIYFGDAVSTIDESAITLRMLDDAEYQLQASSRLMFERYQYEPDTQNGSAVLTLVKGGFRSKTGLLSQHQPTAVAINTAVATVGVPGTEFALRVCARNTCRSTPNAAALDPGLYTGVLEGRIVISNNTGDLTTGRGEFYHIAAPNTVPEATPDAAMLLFNKQELAQLDVVVEEEKPLSFLEWLSHKLFGD